MTTRPREISEEETVEAAISSFLEELIGSAKYQAFLKQIGEALTEDDAQRLQARILIEPLNKFCDEQTFTKSWVTDLHNTLKQAQIIKPAQKLTLETILPERLVNRIVYSYRRPALDALSRIDVAYDEYVRDFSKLSKVEYKETPDHPISREDIQKNDILPLFAPPEEDEKGNRIRVNGLEDGIIKEVVAAMQYQIELTPALKDDFRIYFRSPRRIEMPLKEQHQRLTIITQISDVSGENFEPESKIFTAEEKQFYHGLAVGTESLVKLNLVVGKHANVIIIDYDPHFGGEVCLTDSSQFIDDFIDNFEKIGIKTPEDKAKRERIIRKFCEITNVSDELAWNASRAAILKAYIHKILCPSDRDPDPLANFLKGRTNKEVKFNLLRLPIRNSVGPNCMRLALATAYYFNFIDPSRGGLEYFLGHKNRWLSTSNVNTILGTDYPLILSEMVLRFRNKDYRKTHGLRGRGKLSPTYF